MIKSSKSILGTSLWFTILIGLGSTLTVESSQEVTPIKVDLILTGTFESQHIKIKSLISKHSYEQAVTACQQLIEFLSGDSSSTESEKTLNLSVTWRLMAIAQANSYNQLDAIEAAENSVKFLRSLSSDTQLELAYSLQVLQEILVFQSKFDLCEQLAAEYIELFSKIRGQHHPLTLNAQLDLGDVYLNRGEYDRAQSLSDHVINHLGSHAVDAPEILVRALRLKGEVYFFLGNIQASSESYHKALDTHKQHHIDDTTTEAKLLIGIAGTYWTKGDYKIAESYLSQARSMLDKNSLNSAITKAYSLSTTGSLQLNQGDIEQAESLYLQALQMYSDIGIMTKMQTSITTNLGIINQYQDDNFAAEFYFREGLKLRLDMLGPKHEDIAYSLYNLAGLYSETGHYDTSITLCKIAQTILSESIGYENPTTPLLTYQIGINTHWLKQFKEAECLYLKAINEWNEFIGESHPDLAYIHIQLGHLYIETNRIEKAYFHLKKSKELSIDSTGVLLPKAADSMYYLGYIHALQGSYEDSERLFRSSLNLLQKHFDAYHEDYLQVSATFARLESHVGKRESAVARSNELIRKALVDWYQKAPLGSINQLNLYHSRMKNWLSHWLSLSSHIEPSEAYGPLIAIKGLTLEQQIVQRLAAQETSELRQLFDKRLQLTGQYAALKSQDTPLGLSQESLSAWQSSQRHDLEQTWQAVTEIEHQLSMQSADFAFTQQSRSIDFNQLAERLSPTELLVDYFVYERFPTQLANRNNSQPHLVAFILKPNSQVLRIELGPWKPIKDSIHLWRKSIGELSLSLNATLRNARAVAVAQQIWWPLQAHIASDVTRVRLSTDDDLALVPFSALPKAKSDDPVLEDFEFVHVIAARLQLHASNSSRSTESEQQTQGKDVLLVSNVDYGSPMHSNDPPPILEDSQGANKAKQQSLMHLLPPSPSTFRDATDNKRDWKVQSGMVKEGQIIEKLHGELLIDSEMVHLTRGAASETGFLNNAMGKNWIHLSTHGYYFSQDDSSFGLSKSSFGWEDAISLERPNPLGHPPQQRTGLVMAGANSPAIENEDNQQDDGVITAWELSRVNLTGVELAVLSACNTSIGQKTSGEGLLSLQRALHAAGVQVAITSLWPVNDAATTVLMEQFYRNLWELNLSPSTALHKAQRWMSTQSGKDALAAADALLLDTEGNVHPSLWAPWVVSGIN